MVHFAKAWVALMVAVVLGVAFSWQVILYFCDYTIVKLPSGVDAARQCNSTAWDKYHSSRRVCLSRIEHRGATVLRRLRAAYFTRSPIRCPSSTTRTVSQPNWQVVEVQTSSTCKWKKTGSTSDSALLLPTAKKKVRIKTTSYVFHRCGMVLWTRLLSWKPSSSWRMKT